MIDHLRQLFGVCYGEMTQLDQEDCHLFHYSLVYAEHLHDRLSNAFDKSKKTPQTSNDGLASNTLKIL